MIKLDCIAVDDEPLALEKMKDYIERVPFLNLCGTFSNGMEALAFLQVNKIDLAFLDIQMPLLTGIQLLNTLQNRPLVIITTAYSEYAIDGFELEVTDYLLKPIAFERLLKSANKALMRALPQQALQTAPLPTPQASSGFVFIKTEYRLQKVLLDEILYVEGMKDYLMVHTVKEKIMTLMNFKKIAELLPEGEFVRIHKSFMIAISKIEKIERGNVEVNDRVIPIGESYKEAFFAYLKGKGLV